MTRTIFEVGPLAMQAMGWALGRADGRDCSLVHLGEALHLSLSNLVEQTGELMVELQTTSKRIPLIEQNITKQDKVSFGWEVKELGAHIITCSLSNPFAPPKRAFFKFNAVVPFQLRTKVNDRLPGKLLLVEAQLSNVSTATFAIDSIAFIPAQDGAIVKLPYSLEDSSYKNVNFKLGPRCSYQFVFELGHIEHVGGTELGKMDIRWRTDEGDTGRLQTGAITGPSSSITPPLSLHLHHDPLRLHHPTKIHAKIVNNTPRQLSAISLALELGALVPIGVRVGLDHLPAGQEASFELAALPVKPALAETRFILSYTDEWVKHSLPHSHPTYTST